MRTPNDLRKRIEELKSNPQFRYEPAAIQVNAPLALVQVSLAAEVRVLRWALEEKLRPDDRVGPVGS